MSSDMQENQNISDENHDSQIETMRAWFFSHFEDPAERTPYETREGGYQWIWGGPFDALEELENKFSNEMPFETIQELAEELNDICDQWAPVEKDGDYDDRWVEDIAQITEYRENFNNGISNIQKLLPTEVDRLASNCFYSMLFVNVITCLETYLSDAFINTVTTNTIYMRKFIESNPEFKNEKISLSSIFEEYENIEKKAKKHLSDIVWHHIKRIQPMYLSTLGISFLSDTSIIYKAIAMRHDIVHRNGKNKTGIEMPIKPVDILAIISKTNEFIENIDIQLKAIKLIKK